MLASMPYSKRDLVSDAPNLLRIDLSNDLVKLSLINISLDDYIVLSNELSFYYRVLITLYLF